MHGSDRARLPLRVIESSRAEGSRRVVAMIVRRPRLAQARPKYVATIREPSPQKQIEMAAHRCEERRDRILGPKQAIAEAFGRLCTWT